MSRYLEADWTTPQGYRALLAQDGLRVATQAELKTRPVPGVDAAEALIHAVMVTILTTPIGQDAHSVAEERIRQHMGWDHGQYSDWLHGRVVPINPDAFHARVLLEVGAI